MYNLTSIFLSSTQINKIEILDYLIKYKNVKRAELEKNIKISQKNITRNINTLNEELEDIFDVKPIENIGQNYKLNEHFLNAHEQKVIFETRKYYVNHSMVYHILTILLKERKTNTIKLSMSVNVSQSYIYKILHKITSFFKANDLELFLAKEQGEIELLGNEKIICFIKYYIKLFFGESLTNKNSKMAHKGALLSKSIQKYLILSDICVRSTKLNRNVKFTSNILEECIFLIEESIPNLDASLPTSLNKNDLSFFKILTLFYAPELYEKSVFLEIGEKLSQLKDKNSIVSQMLKMIDRILSEFLNSTMDTLEMLGELIVRLIVYKEFEYWKIARMDRENVLQFEKQKRIQKIIESELSCSDKNDYLNSYSFNTSELLTSTLKETSTINLAILLYRKSFNRTIIENFLNSIFTNGIVKICNEANDETDIVISDVGVDKVGKWKYLYFSDINDLYCWNNLSNAIHKCIIEKTLHNYNLV